MRKCFTFDQSIARITLKGVKDGKKRNSCETVVDQKTLTQIQKRYITYFKHKHPIKMEQKLKSATDVFLYFTSLHLNQLLEDIS